MKIAKIIASTFFWILPIISFAQRITIPLIDKVGFNPIGQETILGEKVNDINLFKGLDSLKIKSFKIKKITFYKVQEEVERMILDGLPKEEIVKWVKKYRNTSYIQYIQMPKNHIAFLDGIDSNGRIHFIMDANNNYSFSDDKEYIFDTTKTIKDYPIVYGSFDYFDGTTINKISVPFRIDAYAYLRPIVYSYPNRKDTLKDTRLSLQAYKEGNLRIGKLNYVFTLVNRNMFVYKNEPFEISVQATSENQSSNDRPYIYKSTQLLDINNKLYKIDSLRNNKLYLRFIKKINYGATVGSTAPIIEGRDLITGKYFSLKNKRNSFLLINFWGTWCHPCIKELPALKNFQKKYKNITIVSIAADLPEDTARLKLIINDNELNWPQLWTHRNITNSGVLWDYKVKKFPTTVLIDPEGKIVFNGEGLNVIRKIELYLDRNKE